METKNEESMEDLIRRDNRETRKVFLQMFGTMGLCYGVLWGILSFTTREIHPLRQLHRFEEYSQKREMIFGRNGLADLNNDKALDFHERVDAYRRMGFTGTFYHWQHFYPAYNLDRLNGAIKSYEQEEKDDFNQ